MAEKFAKVLSGTIEGLVKWVIVPITGAIPLLVSSGILLAVYALLWLAFGMAAATSPAALADTWTRIGALPLPLVGAAWLLFMPPMAGLWIWTTDWPLAVRLVLIAGLAGWNLLVFIPRRQVKSGAVVESKAAES